MLPGLATARAPQNTKLVDGNGAQPVAESALLVIVLEVPELADHDRHHLLRQILGVFVLDRVTAQPTTDERRVQVDEPLPGSLIRLQTQALQKGD